MAEMQNAPLMVAGAPPPMQAGMAPQMMMQSGGQSMVMPPGYPQPMPMQGYGQPMPMQAYGQPMQAYAQPGYPQPMGAYGQPVPGQMQPMPMQMQAPGAPGPAPLRYMPAPTGAPPVDCPPGLEYLTMVDQLLVQQQVEVLEVLTGFETNNKYQVKNSLGQLVYFAVEQNDFFTLSCGPARPFKMSIVDNLGKQVMLLDRPFRCQFCCCPCCLQELMVYAPAGTLIGIVRQKWSCCIPEFEVCDANGVPVLRIEGECSCTYDVEFKVYSLDGNTKIGSIRKQWSGLAQELFTDADNFGLTFPADMNVKTKATLFAATFLIDFMYFEDNQQNNRGHHGAAYGRGYAYGPQVRMNL